MRVIVLIIVLYYNMYKSVIIILKMHNYQLRATNILQALNHQNYRDWKWRFHFQNSGSKLSMMVFTCTILLQNLYEDSSLLIKRKLSLCCSLHDMLDCNNADYNFLKKNVTRDETWVYSYDLEKKSHLSEK